MVVFFRLLIFPRALAILPVTAVLNAVEVIWNCWKRQLRWWNIEEQLAWKLCWLERFTGIAGWYVRIPFEKARIFFLL